MTPTLHEERLAVQPDSSAFVADPELLRALETRSTPFTCETDRLLFNQDDPATGVYIVHEGAATLTMNAKHGARIFSIPALPGSLLGLPALISDQPYSLTAIAHAGAKVSFVSRSDFFALVQADPLLSLKMLQVLAAEVRTARQALSH
jgi:CRP-like cAMP-binding protein